MTDCVFCPDNWPNLNIVENRYSAAIINPLAPVTDGHVLVIGRVHYANAAEGPNQASWLVSIAADYIRRQGIEANIITSIGPAATQTVMHTHTHVVPRRPGDGLMLPWTPQHARKAGNTGCWCGDPSHP